MRRKPFQTYILKGHRVVHANGLEWAEWFEKSDRKRRVAKSDVAGLCISTVFLGVDHNFTDDGPPLLFETMVFNHWTDGRVYGRCSTWTQAKAMHKEAVEVMKRCKSRAELALNVTVKKET